MYICILTLLTWILYISVRQGRLMLVRQQAWANNSTLPRYSTKNSPLRELFVYKPMKKQAELFD